MLLLQHRFVRYIIPTGVFYFRKDVQEVAMKATIKHWQGLADR